MTSECQHEAWEFSPPQSRRCADCGEWLEDQSLETAMTSELRPAVEVFRNAVDATGAFVRFKRKSEQAAAAVIQAYGDEREAKGREEQAADLAKFKVLAETLATDLRECARALQSLRQIPGTGADGRLWQRIKEITDDAHAAVAQYKEARDAS